ncbi:hypothetical protein C2S52_008176 [Perilla frutescens var. hirtella]|nr:hypothetical protein C2S51_018091 [Perilla frutescens var. frutescens]KAH6783217.1 hypothetical protein C2S52_008176 [Perilla frutescens var. hirtella]
MTKFRRRSGAEWTNWAAKFELYSDVVTADVRVLGRMVNITSFNYIPQECNKRITHYYSRICRRRDIPTPFWKLTVAALDNKDDEELELQFRGPITRSRAKKLQAYLQLLIRRKLEIGDEEIKRSNSKIVNLLTIEDQEHTMEN